MTNKADPYVVYKQNFQNITKYKHKNTSTFVKKTNCTKQTIYISFGNDTFQMFDKN